MIAFVLLIACSEPPTTAGFGSETTNGVVIALSGVQSYKQTEIIVVPSDYNPYTDSKTSVVKVTPNDSGKARINLKEGSSYSVYAADTKSGRKMLLQNVIVKGDTTLSGVLEPTGDLQVNFVKSEGMLDTVNGYISIDGYPELADTFKRANGAISVTLKNVPRSLLKSVLYGVKKDLAVSKVIGSSVEIKPDSTSEIEYTLYSRFMTRNNSPILSDTVTVVTLGKEPGVVWIGTNQGLTSYKNNSFWNMTNLDSPLMNNLITSVCESSDSVTWFGTLYGLTRFTSTKFNTFCKNDQSIYIPSSTITALASNREGMIWIGTDSGLILLDHNYTYLYRTNQGLPSNFITSLKIDSDGTLWGGTDLGAFSISKESVEKKIVKSYSQTTLTPSGLPVPYITDIEIASDGIVWMGTAGGGLLSFNRGVVTKHIYTSVYTILNFTTSIEADSKGNLWFGTKSGALLKRSNDKWFCYPDENGAMLPNAEILSFTVDKSGNVYCGTLGKGLFLLGPNAQTLFYKE